ncbi:Wadjet anti-phage system protein JetD domain-containing protein [Paraburkholderia humisilvae]|uniref:Wadjet anti-phage system protein JetD domain-containing protein n=1 Tax=Paraburkholderia humisilvae TaxID=627669 RepID=UPI00361349F0
MTRDLPRLTAKERELFDDLRDNRIRHGLRLEQERVGFGWVRAALQERACA